MSMKTIVCFSREQRKRLSAGGGAGPGIPELSEQQEAKQGPRPVENRLSDSHVIAAAASALQQKEQQEGSKEVIQWFYLACDNFAICVAIRMA